MDFRILGPLEARQAGRLLSLGGPKQRALLAVLLLHANRVVTSERLIELIWGEDAPETVGATLQVTVSNLRKVLEPDHERGSTYEVLISQPAGYLLNLSAEQLDSARFEALATAGKQALLAGNPQAAADTLREALALWRGQALADFPDERFALAESRRLDEMMLQAFEDRIEADLALGRHGEMVAALESLLVKHPLRERLCGQLMLALYRSGRQAEASDVYYKTRDALVEQQGMDPGTELQNLLKAILNHHPSLDLRQMPAPRQARPNNLPRQLTTFVGRSHQIQAIQQTLASSRLLTLTGPGGIGKTRLALEVAGQLLEDFADGIWLVELGTVASPELVAQAVASALTLREEAGRRLVDTLIDYLQARQLLLLFDNCEHLVDRTAELVEALLRSCPSLRVLATSREALGIPGESLRQVPSLSLPNHDEQKLDDNANKYEAVALFCDRATIALGSFSLTPGTAPRVFQICRRLDGIPLAIELAAVRLRVLSLDQIAARLNDRFRLLTGGSRTALPRQQTLRATIDWSYDLLPETERALLRRLAVFVGGASLEAAEAICAGSLIASTDVMDLMTQLVAKSLVIAEENSDETQFRLLETIREYGLAKLLEAGEAESLRKRHRDWFIRLAEQSELELAGRDQTRWARRLEAAFDNLRAALEWCSDKGDAEACLRLASAMGAFWRIHGYLSEGREWLNRGLSEGEVAPQIRAKTLVWGAVLAVFQGDSAQALTLCQHGLEAYRSIGDQWGTAFAFQTLGRIALLEDNNLEATSQLERSLSLFRETGDKHGVAESLYLLSVVNWGNGDYSSATRLGTEALHISQQIGDTRGTGNSLNLLGRAEMSQGNLESARNFFGESLQHLQQLGDRRGIAISTLYLATLARYRKDYAVGRALAQESLSTSQRIADRLLYGIALSELGMLALHLNNRAEASRILQLSLETLLQTNEKLYLARSMEALAAVAHQLELHERSAILLAAADRVREEIRVPVEPLEVDGHKRLLISLRARLGEGVWSKAWSEGRKLTPADAVALMSGSADHERDPVGPRFDAVTS